MAVKCLSSYVLRLNFNNSLHRSHQLFNVCILSYFHTNLKSTIVLREIHNCILTVFHLFVTSSLHLRKVRELKYSYMHTKICVKTTKIRWKEREKIISNAGNIKPPRSSTLYINHLRYFWCTHFFVNFDMFKWLYLTYFWVYLHQTWWFWKTWSALCDYVDQYMQLLIP